MSPRQSLVRQPASNPRGVAGGFRFNSGLENLLIGACDCRLRIRPVLDLFQPTTSTEFCHWLTTNGPRLVSDMAHWTNNLRGLQREKFEKETVYHPHF
jgi:hypothetical protein